MGSQRVRHNLATGHKYTNKAIIHIFKSDRADYQYLTIKECVPNAVISVTIDQHFPGLP